MTTAEPIVAFGYPLGSTSPQTQPFDVACNTYCGNGRHLTWKNKCNLQGYWNCTHKWMNIQTPPFSLSHLSVIQTLYHDEGWINTWDTKLCIYKRYWAILYSEPLDVKQRPFMWDSTVLCGTITGHYSEISPFGKWILLVTLVERITDNLQLN